MKELQMGDRSKIIRENLPEKERKRRKRRQTGDMTGVGDKLGEVDG